MTKRTPHWTLLLALAFLAAASSTASAQYRPRPIDDPATGEKYHIEASAALWWPNADITIASEGLGIAGSSVNAKTDLGLVDQRFPQVRLVLRPTKSSKFRAEFIPIKYEQTASIPRTIVFNGQAYAVGVPVASSVDWKAWRFGYEYDFIVKNRGFVGFLVEAKYTDVQVQLTALAAKPIAEFAHAVAPIPAIGGVARYYFVPNISVTAELSGFKLPNNAIKDTNAHYVDVDVYGTLNFTNNIGAQVGYRSLDVGYLVKTDTGAMTLRGIYAGVVARF